MVCCTWSHVAVVREFAWSSSSSPPPPAAGACTSARTQRAQLSRSKHARTKNPHLRFGWRRREYAGKAARHTSSATRERAVVAAVGCMDRRRGAEGFYRRPRAYFALPLMVLSVCDFGLVLPLKPPYHPPPPALFLNQKKPPCCYCCCL